MHHNHAGACDRDDPVTRNGLFPAGQPPEARNVVTHVVAVLLLLGLTFAMFADVLIAPGSTVLSSSTTDLATEYIHWRDFGFSEIRAGNLPLWNPYSFSGAPFFAGFLSSLLYPFNAVYLVLPLAAAVNWSIALHVFLLGAFMYLWALSRGLHPAACFLASALLMFGGAYFPHIFGGHLGVLSVLVWAPLLFLSFDKLADGRSFAWCLPGMLAVAMQILGGQPQCFYFTAVSIGIYAAFCLWRAPGRLRLVGGLFCAYAGGCALGAVQLLTGLDAARESVRTGGVSYAFASTFSLPPENVLTLLAPFFFGDGIKFPYWGRCYSFEMTLFIGVTGLLLAVLGAVYGDRRVRRFSVCMALILLLLALGRHTPLFKVLYAWVPGYDRFRGQAKFSFQASMFLVMLAGIGLDQLLRGAVVRRRALFLVLAASLVVGVCGLWIRLSVTHFSPQGPWARVVRTLSVAQEVYLSKDAYAAPGFAERAGSFASRGLILAAGTLALVCAVLWSLRYSRRMAWLLVVLAIVEVFVFARRTRVTFDLAVFSVPQLREFLARHPDDCRILISQQPNLGISLRRSDIWGYEPGVVQRRYMEFMAATQGASLKEMTGYVRFHNISRLYSLLRLRYALVTTAKGSEILDLGEPLPYLQLLTYYTVAEQRDQVFAAISEPSFNPRRRVVLEKRPDPLPVPSVGLGSARIVDSSTDHLTIEADLESPAILLVTDSYSSGWRATALPGSDQTRYEVMPANYVLRAVPLSAGHHRFRMEYAPRAFLIGAWISILSLVVYLSLIGLLCARRVLRYHSEVPKPAGKSIADANDDHGRGSSG
jgi:hypothetical protein